MSTDQQPPARKTLAGFWAAYGKRLMPLVTTLAAALLASALTYAGLPEKVVNIVVPVLVPAPFPVLDEFTPATGWVRDEEVIAANTDPAKTLQFADTPAGKVAQGDEDVLLYRVVRKVAKLPAGTYPNINQGSVGYCVGAGSKHGCDVVQATAIAAGANFDWKPVSAEAIYAGSRIDVGRGQIRGDGSVGRWSMEYLRDKGGMAPMEKIGPYDLSENSPARAREWGRTGAPPEVRAVAKLHPVKGAALVKSAVDVKRAIGQYFPVVTCSSVGFNNPNGTVGTRDAQGFISPRGTWPHCMCFIGWRGGARPGALCLNSWGDTAHGGPVWPEDAPRAAFWVDEAVVDRMVREGDSFALSDVVGFPAREKLPIDWFVRAQEPRPRMPIELFPVALAW